MRNCTRQAVHFRAENVFLENQRCSGFVIKGQRLVVIGIDYHRLCAGRFINGEAGIVLVSVATTVPTTLEMRISPGFIV